MHFWCARGQGALGMFRRRVRPSRPAPFPRTCQNGGALSLRAFVLHARFQGVLRCCFGNERGWEGFPWRTVVSWSREPKGSARSLLLSCRSLRSFPSRQERVKDAMRKMEDLVLEYRQVL